MGMFRCVNSFYLITTKNNSPFIIIHIFAREIFPPYRSLKSKINSSFSSALNSYSSFDYLDDIRETVVENRRVLAVKAMYRRKVKGSILGSSKTGSIVYIEPETTLQYHRELNNLE